MLEMLDTAKVIICVGSGGVGKTTLAASLGFVAAKRGRRVLVLTIDPSQRLKTTLALSDTGEVSQLKHPDITTGSFSASVIDAKRTFDDFVRRAAQKDSVANKILNNKLYQQMSTNLSGSQEFTALEKLYTSTESGLYDLVILDTPPTKHAIDFLNAPQKLSGLFNESVAKWFRTPTEKRSFLAGILQAGTVQVLKALEGLTGSEFMHELGDFFQNIQSWQSKLEERVVAAQRLLVRPTTQFCLITGFDQAKLKEASYFAREIRKGGYKISSIIVNRAFPLWLVRSKSQTPPSNGSWLEQLFNELSNFYRERDQVYLRFTEHFAAEFVADGRQKDMIFRIPEFDRDIANLSDVAELAKVVEQGGQI
jgi:anion-transporting  ArsA/GET3 family ATPase